MSKCHPHSIEKSLFGGWSVVIDIDEKEPLVIQIKIDQKYQLEELLELIERSGKIKNSSYHPSNNKAAPLVYLGSQNKERRAELHESVQPVQKAPEVVYVQPQDKKGGLFTKIKCPRCRSLNFSLIDTKKKFSYGKAIVGNTIGGLLAGAVGAIIGVAAGINGKNGKTKFVCHNCGKVWEQKV